MNKSVPTVPFGRKFSILIEKSIKMNYRSVSQLEQYFDKEPSLNISLKVKI